ncbi:phosphotransferase family protein [Gordonia sp. ABSL1-1]|uniref:phosphotransferase family protein n=1 Tax=Gordonia sp. ABSL1-1 TaxID=3053923 RepID=UPI0025722D1E|nr:phosphotransferase family protein [Gordonia sp. ABSL1-1]MDL9935243.1 phosphotransferase family protein [Gordonia sp. ABSL1-1]
MTAADEVGARIAERLAQHRGSTLFLRDARILPAGASRATYLLGFEADDGRTESVIVRAVPAADDGDGGLRAEVDVLTAAAQAGVKVPEVLDHGFADSVLGYPYLVMNFVAGESIPRKILRDDNYAVARTRFVAQAGAELACVHRIDRDRAGALVEQADPLAALRQLCPREYDEMPAGLALAVRWLADHRPPPSPRITVVHGDFRLGNLLIDADGIAAVLDWELTHIGDPLEDLGWLCAKAWRFSVPRPVAGMGERADLLDAYAAAAGWRPTEEALRWWELYATVRWGLLCAVQANRHLDGTERSVELAAIGRRSAEQEFDALLDLGIATPGPVDDPIAAGESPTSPTDLYGSPSIEQLLAAVADFLRQPEVGENLPGHIRFHTRVAANVVDVVRRQLLDGPDMVAQSVVRLRQLGIDDQRDLARRILDGRLDIDDQHVRAAVAADVRARLAVANPRYFAIEHP